MADSDHSHRALILAHGIRGEHGTRRLLGLQVTERIVVNLHKREVADVAVVGTADLLPTSRRDGVNFVDTEEGEVAAIASAMAEQPGDLLILAADSVYHPELPRALRRRAGTRGRSQLVMEQPGHPALYLRGEDAGRLPEAKTLYELVTTLLEGGVCEEVDDQPELFVVPVTSPEERKFAERRLIKLNWRPHDGIVAKHINKYVSVEISTRLADTFITPNQMTLGAAVIGLAGVMICTWGTYVGFVLGALLMQIQSILDGCDGELARMRYQSSRIGAWLDTAVDDILGVLWVTTIGIGLYRGSGHVAYLVAGVAGGLLHLVGSGLIYATLIKNRASGHSDLIWWFDEEPAAPKAAGDAAPPAKPKDHTAPFYTYLLRRDLYVLVFLGLAVVNLMPVALFFAAAGAAALCVTSMIQISKRGFTLGGPPPAESPASNEPPPPPVESTAPPPVAPPPAEPPPASE